MAVYTERKAGSPLADFVGEHAQVLSIAMFFLLCMAIFGMAISTFLSAGNLLNILRQAAPILIVAVAMTMVITIIPIPMPNTRMGRNRCVVANVQPSKRMAENRDSA